MGKIKVQSASLTNTMQISIGNSEYAVSVTNNRAQYYSEQAKKYRDEAKTSRDEAKYYAEQNSNVTLEYIEGIKNSLVQQINTKQIQGDYALSSDIPLKISSLENDSKFVTIAELNQSIAGNTTDKDLSGITDLGKAVIRKNSYTPPLLQSFWSDHILNRVDILRADTFSWQDGSMYELSYNELVSEYNNANSTEETEDSITYRLTPNGFKIADSTHETAILNKYNTEGSAWFYLLDIENTRFKLPRMKYKYWENTSNATEESEKYLYFYIGEFTQKAVEQTAGLNAELFNGKADLTTPSIQAPYLRTTYINGTSGYRIWSDGYCEQWGLTAVFTTNPVAISFLKIFSDTDYNIQFTPRGTNARGYAITCSVISATGFSAICGYGTNSGVSSGATGDCQVGWKVCGYLAEGEY